jgi:hypothetical protein
VAEILGEEKHQLNQAEQRDLVTAPSAHPQDQTNVADAFPLLPGSHHPPA